MHRQVPDGGVPPELMAPALVLDAGVIDDPAMVSPKTRFWLVVYANKYVPIAPAAYPPTAPVTNAVVASCVVLVPAVAVGAAGVPVSVGLASGAKLVDTNAVVASCVVLVPPAAVGAAGTPVNVGDASGAYAAKLPQLALVPSVVMYFPAFPVCDGSEDDRLVEITNAVVASCVVFVPPAAVGPAGTPVNVGDARAAFASN